MKALCARANYAIGKLDFGGIKGIAIAVFLIASSIPALAFAEDINIRHVTAAEASTLLNQQPKIQILDVRTPAEFKAGHIKGAINIDYYAKDYRKSLSALDKNAYYLLHCRSGARSGRSLPIMKTLGFKNIIHLDKGFNAWKSANLPVDVN